MKIHDIIVSALLAFAITFGIRYFFEPKVQEEKEVISGRKREIPASEDLVKPMDKHINFIDIDKDLNPTETKVLTYNGYYVFTTQGAGLKQAYFKHYEDSLEDDYLCALNVNDVNLLPFLVALNCPTPLDYKLISNITLDSITELVYQAETPNGTLKKKFSISSLNNSIDLSIISDLINIDSQLRLFISTPLLCSTTDLTINGLVNTQSSNTNLKKVTNEESQAAWDIPKLFGSESRYFASIVYNQVGDKAQRGSFKLEDNNFISILETPRIKGTGQWDIKCYFGPKKVNSLDLVDKRLSQILDYGWFSPISKALLYVLNILFSYLKNYGLAIILLSLLIKLLLLPISWKGEIDPRKQAEQAKKLAYLKQKYRNDPESLQKEQHELAKESISGIGFFAQIIQFPFIIAFQRILSNSVELYKAPFFWIPNLSEADPYYILSLFIALFFFVSLFKNKTSIKQQLIPFGIGLVMISFSLKLSAGLNLTLLVNFMFNQIQSYAYRKHLGINS